MTSPPMKSLHALAFLSMLTAGPVAAQDVDLGPPFGTVRLVDEIDCGDPSDPHERVEAPAGASRIETILGRSARVMPNEDGARYFAYRIGADSGLEAGRAYVLSVEYPEDGPRTMFIANRGAEQVRGLSTGVALGDALGGYTNNDLESLDLPLSGEWETHRTLFFLHERSASIELSRGADPRPDTPADGFWVVLAQLSASDAPLSGGAAVARIRLYEVPDVDALYPTLPYPPEGLPRRHLFWREEMSDNAIGTRGGNQPATSEAVDWFEHKARLMRFLGMNTFAKDLLEFGANQGWDSTGYGGNAWVYQPEDPDLWSRMIGMLAGYDHYVLPYFEYAGSKGSAGLGFERRAEPLGRPAYDPDRAPPKCGGYTHITWSEVANVDVTDPETFEDLRRMLELTVIDHADRVSFVGAWIRNRVSDMPISFADATRARFAEMANGGAAVDRADLQSDEALYRRYVEWFHGQRVAFLVRIRDYLRERLGDDALVLYTPFSEEPGPSVSGGVVADDPSRLGEISAQSWSDYLAGDGWLGSVLTPHVNWTDGECGTPYEWHHANPPPPPPIYGGVDGVLTTFPFHRTFTVERPSDMDAYRSPNGLAMVRHYPLNENRMDDRIGYFVSDVDRAGPYSMLSEARALAHGDPRFVGYLASHSFNRGFPEHVQAFNLAFLALPAVPSRVETDAASDPGVVVRSYPTADHGTFVAVINTGVEATEVDVTLPIEGAVTDRVSGQALATDGATLRLALGPAEVRALHVDASAPPVMGDDAGTPQAGDGGAPAGADAGPGVDPEPTGGCACRAGTIQARGGSSLAWIGLALCAWARRRRAR